MPVTEPSDPRDGTPATRGEFLRRRNALWASLRALEPDDPAAEDLIDRLTRLTRLTRDEVLRGLGWA